MEAFFKGIYLFNGLKVPGKKDTDRQSREI